MPRNSVPDFKVGDPVLARVADDWHSGYVSRKLSRGRGARYDVRFDDGSVGRELMWDSVKETPTMAVTMVPDGGD